LVINEESIYDARSEKHLKNGLLINPIYLDMFRATILPIFRSFSLYNTACGLVYPIYYRSVIW